VASEVVLGELRRGQVRAAYLLVGDDQLAIRRVIAAVREHLSGDGAADLVVHDYRAGESQGRDVAETLRMLPLLGPHRLVIVREPERFSEADQQLITAAVRAAGPGCYVVVVSGARGGGPAGRAAAAVGVAVQCRAPYPERLPAWVLGEARQLGLRMDADAAALLIDLAGADRLDLAGELEKLRLSLGDNARVTVPQVESVVARAAAGSPFRVADAVGRGDAGAVARLLTVAMRAGEKPLLLLALFAGHLRRLWRAHELVRAGHSPKERADALHAWGPRLNDLEAQAKRFPEDVLRQALCAAADVDVAIKSGRGDPARLVESYLLGLARSAGQRGAGRSSGPSVTR
jgi:DNA polymerase-3 subunit delta